MERYSFYLYQNGERNGECVALYVKSDIQSALLIEIKTNNYDVECVDRYPCAQQIVQGRGILFSQTFPESRIRSRNVKEIEAEWLKTEKGYQ